ncbi:hypothetical protein GCM10010286_38250 [Streptomyces toxytricini]|nr:hypothetical protein GCM10010286_38250 [Streptomyces toxytricini]
MAAAVHDPDPGFCLRFVEPAVYAYGRGAIRDPALDDTGDAEAAWREARRQLPLHNLG